MKFGQVFQERLKSEGFPPDWVESAISYRQLKKCIHRLTDELAQVGLDPDTLGQLLKHVEDYNASAHQENDDERPFEYIFDGDALSASREAGLRQRPKKTFHPKLLFYVSDATGELLHAKLDADTRSKLQMLAVETGLSDFKVLEQDDADLQSIGSGESVSSNAKIRPGHRTVEIPLTSDSEFFTMLSSELSGLEKLQEKEEKRMHAEIEELGKQVAKLTDPDRRQNRKLLTTWRKIFQLYVESGIFFGTTEADHAPHDADKATERFQIFSNKIVQEDLVTKFKGKEQIAVLNTFLHLNQEILQGLRFGEINRIAMDKILKKFDKRTALGVKTTFPQRIQYPEFSEHLAKAVCAEVNTQILSHVPQLEDYECPMCTDLKWRPVKLACGHIFCIRCLIVMQTRKQHHCPLCREKTVVDANSDNLDVELANFLKKWFPDEVKAKQKYNELMAGVDQYGEVYKERCTVM